MDSQWWWWTNYYFNSTNGAPTKNPPDGAKIVTVKRNVEPISNPDLKSKYGINEF